MEFFNCGGPGQGGYQGETHPLPSFQYKISKKVSRNSNARQGCIPVRSSQNAGRLKSHLQLKR